MCSHKLISFHFLAYIDSATVYYSKAAPQEQDPIWVAMMSTIRSLRSPQYPVPNITPPRSDDFELVMRGRVFFDEPQMQIFISSLDEKSRFSMEAAADRERSRLPIFPIHLRSLITEKT